MAAEDTKPELSPLERIYNWIKNEKKPDRAGLVVAVIINFILVYVANQLLSWNLSFIADSWIDVLWAVNLLLVVNIILNAAMIFIRPRWFINLARVIMNYFSALAAWTVYQVFPFTVSTFNELILNIILILIIVVSVVVLIISAIKLLVNIMIKVGDY